jgi:hypothetical protein
MTKRVVGTTEYFVDAPSEHSQVLEWFRALDPPPTETRREGGVLFYFDVLGPIEADEQGRFSVHSSPMVNVFLPKTRRGVLWTAGEVHFLTKRSAPAGKAMQSIHRRFQRWLTTFTQVYGSGTAPDLEMSYYLEGSVRNFASRVVALPDGLSALHDGKFIVLDQDNEAVLDKLCRTLRLRGIECEKRS